MGRLGDSQKMLEDIMIWADKHIPREKTVDATLLAMRIFNESRINSAEGVSVGDSAVYGDSGNLPALYGRPNT